MMHPPALPVHSGCSFNEHQGYTTMTSIMTNSAAMAALQTLRSINTNMEDAERTLLGYRVEHRGRQRCLLVDRDHHALRQQGALHRSGCPRPRCSQGRHRLFGHGQLDQGHLRDQGQSSLRPVNGCRQGQDQQGNHRTQEQLSSSAESASFSGVNWLFNNNAAAVGPKQIVSSFNRASDGSVSVALLI